MRALTFALLLLASASAYAGQEPIDHPTQTEKVPEPDLALNTPPPFAFSTPKSPRAPQTLVIVACRVDDLTGQPGRFDPALAARGWRDLELHVNQDQEFECKREQLDLEDAVALNYPSDKDDPEHNVQLHAQALNADFSNWTQCARVGVVQAQQWNEKHPGYAVVGVGCPVPIVDEQGRILDYKLPECPTYLPGTNNRMKCRFDASAV